LTWESVVRDNNGILSFDASIDLSHYGLPLESPAYVEAYRQTAWMRFDYGTASAPEAKTDNRLSGFDSLDGIRFRVKVAQSDGTHGKLLAVADKICPVSPEDGDSQRQCILPVKSEEMDCIWKLDFENEPILLISKKAGSKDIISKSMEFRTLAYPSILREVLHEIKNSGYEWKEDEDSWQNQWLKFINGLPSVGEMPGFSDEGQDSYCQWVDDAVESFCRNLRIIDTFVSYTEGEE